MGAGAEVVDHEPCTTVSLPHGRESVARAQELMVAELRDHDLDAELVCDAELVVVELMANAYEHGRPDEHGAIEASWCVFEDHLRISVLDGGDVAHLEPLPLDPTRDHGRGLRIVDALCRTWRTDNQTGTRVTAELAMR